MNGSRKQRTKYFQVLKIINKIFEKKQRVRDKKKMNSKTFLVVMAFIFLISFSLFIHYSTKETYFSAHFMNSSGVSIDGDAWNKLKEADKFTYLAGYFTEDKMAPNIGQIYQESARQELHTENLMLKEFVIYLDRFYSDTDNKKVPLVKAKGLVLRQIRKVRGFGDDPVQNIQRDLGEARAEFKK